MSTISIKLGRYFWILVFFGGLAFTSVCKKSQEESPADTSSRQQIERTAGYTAATVTDLGGKLFAIAIGFNLDFAGGRTEHSLLNDLSYDPNTGWWSLSIDLDNGQNADIYLRFLDSSGSFHQFFGRSTDHIQSNGSGSGTDGSFTYDFTIIGVSPVSSTYTIDGSGTTSYQGKTTSWTVDNMTFNKQEDEYPESGLLSITIDGVTITVTFTGSQMVQVTYSYNGHSYTITINLETGEIT
jgi:hypothetical protein